MKLESIPDLPDSGKIRDTIWKPQEIPEAQSVMTLKFKFRVR
jgi:hypothetical protein